MKKIFSRIYNLSLLAFANLLLSGCLGGGGSSGSAGSLFSGSGGGSGGGGGGGGGITPTTYSNPEPSSLLLLASGLIGMAFYTKAKLKRHNKN